MGVDVNQIWVKIRDYPNVVGYSPRIVKEISSGRVKNGWAFRVYVSHKIPKSNLKPCDVLPDELNGVPIDVVEFRPYFKDEVTLGRGVGWFNQYYSSVSFLLLGLILHLVSFMIGVMMIVYGSSNTLLTIPVAGLLLGETLICLGFTHLTAETL